MGTPIYDDDGNVIGYESQGEPEEELDEYEAEPHVYDDDEEPYEPERGEFIWNEASDEYQPHGFRKTADFKDWHDWNGIDFPRADDFNDPEDHQKAKALWESRQKGGGGQTVVHHHHGGQGRPGYDPTSDPAALSRAELEYRIAENLNKAAKLRSQMDYKEAEEREQVAGLYQRDLDAMPEHPEATSRKRAAINQFEHEIEAVSDPRAFSEMLDIFTGHESKVLTDCRTRLRDFCLYGDKNYFYVQPNDYGTAAPSTLKPPIKVSVEPSDAEEIRRAVSYGSTLEEQIRTLHQQLDRRNLLPSTRAKKGEAKDIESMSQVEYEAWRKKSGDLPVYSSPLDGYAKAAGLKR